MSHYFTSHFAHGTDSLMDLSLLLLSSVIGTILRVFLARFPTLYKATPILLGIWEGVALYQQLYAADSYDTFTPYVPTLLSVAIDFILEENAPRSLLIIMWAMLSAAACSALSAEHGHDTRRHRRRRHRKRSSRRETVVLRRNHRRPSSSSHREIQSPDPLTNVQIISPLPTMGLSTLALVGTQGTPSDTLYGPSSTLRVPQEEGADLDGPNANEDILLRSNNASMHDLQSLYHDTTEFPPSPIMSQVSGDDEYGQWEGEGESDGEESPPPLEGWVKVSLPAEGAPQGTSPLLFAEVGHLSTIPEESSESNTSPLWIGMQMSRPLGPTPDDQDSLDDESDSMLSSPHGLGTDDDEDPLATPVGTTFPLDQGEDRL